MMSQEGKQTSLFFQDAFWRGRSVAGTGIIKWNKKWLKFS